MSQSLHLIETLKSVLKSQNITYKQIAKHLKLTEAGVKKALNSESIALERVEKIAMMTGHSLLDVLKLSEEQNTQKQLVLNLEQENCLAQDEGLFVSYHAALSGYSFEQVLENFIFSATDLERYWLQLEEMGLLRMVNPRQIILKSVLNPLWIDGGPLLKKYSAKLAKEFVVDGIENGRSYKRFLRGGISEQAFDLFVTKMQQLEHEFAQHALPSTSKGVKTMALYHCIRPWKFSVIEKYRRKSQS